MQGWRVKKFNYHNCLPHERTSLNCDGCSQNDEIQKNHSIAQQRIHEATQTILKRAQVAERKRSLSNLLIFTDIFFWESILSFGFDIWNMTESKEMTFYHWLEVLTDMFFCQSSTLDLISTTTLLLFQFYWSLPLTFVLRHFAPSEKIQALLHLLRLFPNYSHCCPFL